LLTPTVTFITSFHPPDIELLTSEDDTTIIPGEVDGNAFDEDGTESKPGSFTTTNPTAPTTTKATTIIDIAELFMVKQHGVI
jgi:hypothetical protein